MLHPQLESSELGDERVDLHRNRLTRRDVVDRGEIDLEKADFQQFAFGVGYDLTRRITASYLGREEAELRGLAGDEREVSSFDQDFGPFLHSLQARRKALSTVV